MIAITYIVVYVAAASHQVSKSVSVRPIETTLCQLLSDPTSLDGKLVQFSADFESDGIERSLLVDKGCGGNGGLPPDVPNGIPGGKALDDAIGTAFPGTLDKRISAVFTGIFHFTLKPEMCMFASKVMCQRSITLTRITNLVLTMKQKR